MASEFFCDACDQVVVDRVGFAGRVDDEVSVGVLFCLIEVALADAAVVGVAFGFHAVLGRVELFATQERVHPGLRGFRIDIKDDDEVWPVLAKRDTAHGEDVGDRQAPGRALVSQRRGDESVGDDEFAPSDRRRDALGDELRPAGHEQEHLAADVHGVGLFVLGVEEDFADFFADVRPAGLADFADG